MYADYHLWYNTSTVQTARVYLDYLTVIRVGFNTDILLYTQSKPWIEGENSHGKGKEKQVNPQHNPERLPGPYPGLFTEKRWCHPHLPYHRTQTPSCDSPCWLLGALFGLEATAAKSRTSDFPCPKKFPHKPTQSNCKEDASSDVCQSGSLWTWARAQHWQLMNVSKSQHISRTTYAHIHPREHYIQQRVMP